MEFIIGLQGVCYDTGHQSNSNLTPLTSLTRALTSNGNTIDNLQTEPPKPNT